MNNKKKEIKKAVINKVLDITMEIDLSDNYLHPEDDTKLIKNASDKLMEAIHNFTDDVKIVKDTLYINHPDAGDTKKFSNNKDE